MRYRDEYTGYRRRSRNRSRDKYYGRDRESRTRSRSRNLDYHKRHKWGRYDGKRSLSRSLNSVCKDEYLGEYTGELISHLEADVRGSFLDDCECLWLTSEFMGVALGGRREDDWTCPSCGNVNFSFRTTCNMRNCTQPRPANHNYKSGGKAMQTPQGYASAIKSGGKAMQTPQGYASATAGHYVGSGAPSSMYIGVQPYGSSLSMPSPYDVHVPSAYHYSYGILLSGGSSPYRPLPPPTLWLNHSWYVWSTSDDGPILAFGPHSNGSTTWVLSRRESKESDNDWVCPDCGNVNFSFRTVCNMRKCNTPKPGSQASKSGKNSKGDMPDGSWKCDQCNNINYPFRTKFSRQNCGAEKPSESGKSPTKEAEENDQKVGWMFKSQGLSQKEISSIDGWHNQGLTSSKKNILTSYFVPYLFSCCCFSLIDSLQLLIGLFNLDPNRVFDIVLECFKLQPDNNVFLNLIPVFPKLARTCYNFYQSTPTKLALMFKSLFVIYTRWTTTNFLTWRICLLHDI
uniref:RanBP2-type domain-containing protein n=1 Tax=Lactuca sativa TaxID=4236 RepID=A0A9R1WUF1_LACSA|nr:hypothetical protein LSAT_V11C100049230 [Lactuca sativa]